MTAIVWWHSLATLYKYYEQKLHYYKVATATWRDGLKQERLWMDKRAYGRIVGAGCREFWPDYSKLGAETPMAAMAF